MNQRKRHDPEIESMLWGVENDPHMRRVPPLPKGPDETRCYGEPGEPFWSYDVTASDLCEQFLQISQTKLGSLVRNGIAIKSSRGRYRLDETVGNYIRHLQIVAAGREKTSEQEKVKAQDAVSRLRLIRANARKAELQVAEKEGHLVDAKAAQARMEGVCLQIRAAMLAVPSRAGQAIPGLTKSQIVALDSVVRDALAQASEGRFDD